MAITRANMRLAALRRALNGVTVCMVEKARGEGIVLVLEGDGTKRVTLWADEAKRLRVAVDEVEIA